MLWSVNERPSCSLMMVVQLMLLNWMILALACLGVSAGALDVQWHSKYVAGLCLSVRRLSKDSVCCVEGESKR